jgi:hypothetical protein
MLPLEGVTVISLEQAVAAPFATRQLADLEVGACPHACFGLLASLHFRSTPTIRSVGLKPTDW